MSNALMWSVLSAVVGGFIIKLILEWFNAGRYKLYIDIIVAITVFIAVGGLITKGIKTAVSVINSIPK